MWDQRYSHRVCSSSCIRGSTSDSSKFRTDISHRLRGCLTSVSPLTAAAGWTRNSSSPHWLSFFSQSGDEHVIPIFGFGIICGRSGRIAGFPVGLVILTRLKEGAFFLDCAYSAWTRYRRTLPIASLLWLWLRFPGVIVEGSGVCGWLRGWVVPFLKWFWATGRERNTCRI